MLDSGEGYIQGYTDKSGSSLELIPNTPGPMRRSRAVYERKVMAARLETSRNTERVCEIRQCFVYILKAKGKNLVKIGFTRRPIEERIEELQKICPYDLEPLILFMAGPEDERGLHQSYDRFRIGREWFRYSRELQEALQFVYNRDIAKGKYTQKQIDNFLAFEPFDDSASANGF